MLLLDALRKDLTFYEAIKMVEGFNRIDPTLHHVEIQRQDLCLVDHCNVIAEPTFRYLR